MKDRPPRGVTGPSHLGPPSASEYRLPLNNTIPVRKNHPGRSIFFLCSSAKCRDRRPTRINARLWMN